MSKYIYNSPDNEIDTIGCDWNEGDNLLNGYEIENIDKYVRVNLEKEISKKVKTILDIPDLMNQKLTAGSDVGLFITLLYLANLKYDKFRMRKNDYAQVRAFAELSFSNIELVEDNLITNDISNNSIIYLSNPGNPNCQYFKDEDLLKIIEDNYNCFFIIDLAYIEYEHHFDLSLFENLCNVLFIRTFSKFWGSAGARLGSLVFPENSVLNNLYQTLNSKNISRQHVQLIDNINKNKSYIIKTRKSEKLKLQKIKLLIEELFLVDTKTAGNFITINCKDESTKNEIIKYFYDLNITVRDLSHLPGYKQSVRFSYREKAFEKLFF